MHRTRMLVALTIALATSIGVSSAQAASGPVSSNDRAFVAGASESNATAIAFAKEATEKGSAATKTFAHTTSLYQERLAAVLTLAALPLGLKVYKTPSVKQGRTIGRVGKLQGAAFDRAYRTQQVLAHEAMLVIYQNEIAHGSSSALKRAASVGIATVKGILARAEKLPA